MYTHCFILFINIYFWQPWVFVAARGLSLVAESRGYSLVAVHGHLTVAFEHRLNVVELLLSSMLLLLSIGSRHTGVSGFATGSL